MNRGRRRRDPSTKKNPVHVRLFVGALAKKIPKWKEGAAKWVLIQIKSEDTSSLLLGTGVKHLVHPGRESEDLTLPQAKGLPTWGTSTLGKANIGPLRGWRLGSSQRNMGRKWKV